jgi:hypothetical protein
MRVFCILLAALAATACGGDDTTDGGAGDGGDAGEGGCEKCIDAPAGGPTVTVLNAGGTSLVSFPFDANGDVAPIATIAGDQTNLTQAVAVAADSQGDLYVAVPLAILVFAPYATGNVAPMRTIAGTTALPTTDEFVGVAVAPDGTVYAASELTSGTTRSPKILVFSPGADGNVAPARTITGPTTGMQAVLALGLDSSEVAEADATQKVFFFDPLATGDVAPTRTLSTGSGLATGMALGSNGKLFVAQYNFSSSALVAWAPGASGTTAPLATVTGPTTKITAIGGVAAAPDGTTFVANADPTGAAVLVFAASATGDAAPLRTIAGPTTTLSGDVSQYPMPLTIY